MATEIEICNSAIVKVRGRAILTLNDDTNEAKLCKILYPRVRDRLLRGHPWNFNKRRAVLAASLSVPAFEFDAAYNLPADCGKLLKTTIPVDIKWVLEGKQILTNWTEVQIQYGAMITDATQFDGQFVEVLAWALAAELAYPITQSNSLVASVRQEAKALLQEARSMNGQERGSIEQVGASEWLNARY